MILRTRVATTLVLLLSLFASTADALEPSLVKERVSPNLSPGPCALSVSTNGTAANYRWYNVCSGYIWILSGLEAGESNGVLYGGPLQPAVNDANTVKRAITYWRNVVQGYSQTVDVFLDSDTDGDGCPDAVVGSDLVIDPGLRWNCSEFNTPIPTGITHLIVRTVHGGGSAPTWATDGPFTATCDPNSIQRSFYYGINGSECLPWVGPDGLTDNFLGWLIVDGTPGPPVPVACCFADGSCQDLAPAECIAAGGSPKTLGTNCATFDCPQPPAPVACCFANGDCDDLLADACTAAGGAPQGDGTACATTVCPGSVPVACCFNDGTCADLTPFECAAAGGVALGSGSSCATTECPPLEACCFPTGVCADLIPQACSVQGGLPQGSGSTCAGANCPQIGACCFVDGSCASLTPENCAASGGLYNGDGVTCVQANCPPPSPGSGACCFPDASCVVLTSADCSAAGGAYMGDDVTCAQANCAPPPVVGACCLPGGVCVETTSDLCAANAGVWFPNVPCDPILCITPVESKSWGQIKALYR